MPSSRRCCVNNPNTFCYICGEYVVKKFRKPITDSVKKTYVDYFKIEMKALNKPWVPNIVCKLCSEHLRQWENGKRNHLKYSVPMIWTEPKNHIDDCYFCVVELHGINKRKMTYPDLPSAKRPRLCLNDVPSPMSQDLSDLSDLSDTEMVEVFSDERDSDFEVSTSPSLFSQDALSDLIRDLDLSKERSELLASRLKERNLLSQGTKITFYRDREKEFLPFFSSENDIVYCNNISGLLMKLGLSRYKAEEWRLFMDSSKRSLKCVLLDIGNNHAAVPIAHSTKLKEEYQNVDLVLKKLKYSEHQWVICVDLKMVNFLLGQQSGYTKFPCFICLWDSRAKNDHWIKKDWPLRNNMTVGKQNIINPPLVARDKIILPPLHIKLGLMKQYVKALDKISPCFVYLSRKFPGLSNEKLKAGIFDGPQIRLLMKDNDFIRSMNNLEAAAWTSFVAVVKNFLGNQKAENYEELVQNLLINFKNLGCNMSIKVHYLDNHLDKFPENLGAYSEEQGERFHQDLKVMEDRYQGRWDEHMMADYCWSITRECPENIHRRKSKKRSF